MFKPIFHKFQQMIKYIFILSCILIFNLPANFVYCGQISGNAEALGNERFYYVLAGHLFIIFLISVFMVIIFKKIIKRREFEFAEKYEAVSEKEACYSLLNETTSSFFCRLDKDGRFIYVNQSFETLAGYGKDEILGHYIYEYLMPEEHDVIKGKLLEAFENKIAVRNYVYQFKFKNGNYAWFEMTGNLFEKSGAENYFVAIARDITSSIETEKALKISENKYRNLYENMIDGFVFVDNSGKIIEFNLPYQNMLGYTAEELHNMTFLDVTPPKWHEFQLGLVKNQVRVNGYSDVFEKEYLRKDGTVFPAEIRMYAVRENGKDVGLWGFVRNISERKKSEVIIKQAQNELEKKVCELQRANTELEQFAYVSSHDLKEPLRMIGSFSQLLADKYRGKLDEKADKYINYIVDGVVRMQNLINDLLSYSRVQSKQKEFSNNSSEDIVKKVINNLKILIEENNAAVSYSNLPEIYCDATLMGQLFQNLIQNAIKFHGPDRPEIKISAEVNGPNIKFAVSDNGIGISSEYFERIFIVFQRLHTREQYPGNGIGLSICKKIVERHGGEIWVESVLDKGTTFYFTIPSKL